MAFTVCCPQLEGTKLSLYHSSTTDWGWLHSYSSIAYVLLYLRKHMHSLEKLSSCLLLYLIISQWIIEWIPHYPFFAMLFLCQCTARHEENVLLATLWSTMILQAKEFVHKCVITRVLHNRKLCRKTVHLTTSAAKRLLTAWHTTLILYLHVITAQLLHVNTS